ncbi:isochorismatase hydrolase [Novosphingobium sp. Rr 2-17]|nr:isochorismatase hydrolase [Novosphingobium sp. Rr 2-17]
MSKQALLVVDMQQGLFAGPRHDADGLLARLNALAARLRAKGMPVIFIQHCGPEGDDLHPSQPGHAIHQALAVKASDRIITKASCDAFLGTTLADVLAELETAS